MYAHFSETLHGTSTIRGYGEAASFVAENRRHVERFVQAATYYDANQWWLGMRIDTLSACLSLGVTFFAVYSGARPSPAAAN
jgi:ATP-binding cassette subfamily C (CFTR/MRP) protein 1